MIGGCIGGTPHVGHRPQLLLVYAAPLEKTAALRSARQFRGNADALIVSVLLGEGLQGLHDMTGSSEIAQGRAEQHRSRPANTLSFLVQFALARRGIKDERRSWQLVYEEICHRRGNLQTLIDGKSLAKPERVALFMFLAELEDWLVPEVRRQVQEVP
jgi:hypothetical protein